MFEYLNRQGFKGLAFGNHNQEGWDIKYDSDLALNNEVLIQVKTVSAFAKEKRLSPIHLLSNIAYCEVYLISLDESMIPNDIWKVDGYDPNKIKIINGKEVIKNTRLPKNEHDYSSGFKTIINCFEDFKEKFPELYFSK
jgi:hypothetical protein